MSRYHPAELSTVEKAYLKSLSVTRHKLIRTGEHYRCVPVKVDTKPNLKQGPDLSHLSTVRQQARDKAAKRASTGPDYNKAVLVRR